MRDGESLFAHHFAGNSDMTILLLRQTTGVDVAAQVERHHGQPGGVPDDVDYMGQYETDVANVIAALRHDQPNGRFILAG